MQYLICIFMNINEKMKNGGKNMKIVDIMVRKKAQNVKNLQQEN